MKKSFILLAFMLATLVQFSWAQEDKPGCNPKSCGPENTKVGEAKVISELRESLLAVADQLSKSRLQLQASLAVINVKPASDDEASIQVLIEASAAIRKALVENLEPDQLHAGVKTYNPTGGAGGKNAVLRLQQELDLYKAQLEQL